ncbi:MAG: flagellar basal-body rod protein FlgF [Acidobacteriota bacterium]
MDALIYTVMSGAERAMQAQQVHANNLANLETGGFRADMELARSQVVPGYGFDARHVSDIQTNAVVTRAGANRETGRDLDVAISGQGFFAVQGQQGEAYTRAGAFSLDAEGGLMVNGHPVLGDGGPITLPPFTRVAIAQDGTISIQPPGQQTMQPVDKLKLVTAAPGSLTKNEAGLIVSRTGDPLPVDEKVQVQSGHLEGSNVSAIDEMVATMTLNRDFELQMKLYKAADSMAETGNRLIRE